MQGLRLSFLLCALALGGCRDQPAAAYPGYAEADYVRLASPIGGVLARSHVSRGAILEAGQPAFVLEQESERAALAEAAARVERARAELADLEKGGRPDELAVAQAQLAQGEAALRLSQAELDRRRALLARGFVAQTQVDQALANARSDEQRVRELRARLRVLRLGARSDAVRAAQKEVDAALALQQQAEWRVSRKTVRSPLRAQVVDVLYREGELVEAGAPVVSLLAPQNVRARFFVPQAALGGLRIGQPVSLRCDGCAQEVRATVSFIAPQAEYTAPLIYSQQNRATLVFMAEATPDPRAAVQLHPGQPLEVRPVAATAQ